MIISTIAFQVSETRIGSVKELAQVKYKTK